MGKVFTKFMEVQACVTKGRSVLHSVGLCYTVYGSVTKCSAVLQSVGLCLKVSTSVTKCSPRGGAS